MPNGAMPAVRLNGPAGIAGYRVEVDSGWAAVQHASDSAAYS
jgi:hypothetical protein